MIHLELCRAEPRYLFGYITVHGMGQQQHSQSPPSGQGHQTHPVFTPDGLLMLLEDEIELDEEPLCGIVVR